MLRKFFVYGTLRPGEERWSSLSSFVDGEYQSAILRNAQLYTTGLYPFVVPETDGVVYGEVITVKVELLPLITNILDQIEGYDTTNPAHSLFVRTTEIVSVERPYTVDVVDTFSAYVYTGGRRLAHSAEKGTYARITSGDWKRR